MSAYEHERRRAVERQRIAEEQGGRTVYRACCPRCRRKRGQRHRHDCDLVHPTREETPHGRKTTDELFDAAAFDNPKLKLDSKEGNAEKTRFSKDGDPVELAAVKSLKVTGLTVA